uniref:Large ribosomal subunit protein mL54 n=1 Tax=Timema poppense TaxID=170557 RepID=A0A7R9HB80_TIMPO|nr:unnamed protein product [Timema poppensis]
MNWLKTLTARNLPSLGTLRNYAKKADVAIASLGKSKKKLSKLGPMIEKKILPVETDSHKLINFVCGSNILKEGPDIAIKPDSEYPDWLWNIRTVILYYQSSVKAPTQTPYSVFLVHKKFYSR